MLKLSTRVQAQDGCSCSVQQRWQGTRTTMPLPRKGAPDHSSKPSAPVRAPDLRTCAIFHCPPIGSTSPCCTSPILTRLASSHSRCCQLPGTSCAGCACCCWLASAAVPAAACAPCASTMTASPSAPDVATAVAGAAAAAGAAVSAAGAAAARVGSAGAPRVACCGGGWAATRTA